MQRKVNYMTEEIIKRWNNVDIFDMLFGEKEEVENKCAPALSNQIYSKVQLKN